MQTVKGMRDILPPESKKFRKLIEKIVNVFESWGYEEVITPALEYLELFERKNILGEENIKDVYKFQDKKGRWLCLKFEMTAPICRIISTKKDLKKPIKWYYVDRVWRYENPQRGRYREFWQAGIEFIGEKSLLADAEVIAISYECLKKLDIKGTIWINDRRCCDEIVEKLGNPKILKVMDKKYKLSEEEFRKEIEEIIDYYEFEKIINNYENLKSYKYLEELQKYLDNFEVKYEINPFIVRGLEYYTGPIFEIYTETDIGAVGGGGRYDNLINLYGGGNIPATGFAFGLSRLLEIVDIEIESEKIIIIPLKEEFLKYALKVREKFGGMIWYRFKIKDALSYASDFDKAIIIGEKEVKEGKITIKNLRTGEQKTIHF
jgi:histidyl-tRNA synthetase